MNRQGCSDIGTVLLAALPLGLIAYTYSFSAAELRHTPIEVARVYRAILFAGIACSTSAAVLAVRRWLASRASVLAITAIVLAITYLVWALPLAWSVIGAMWIYRDI